MKKFFYLFNLVVCSLLFFCVTARGQAPIFSLNPSNDSVCAGAAANFSVVVTDADTNATIFYEWFLMRSGSSTWDTVANSGPYSGAKTNVLRVSGADSLNSFTFRCVAYAIDTFIPDTVYTGPSLSAVLTVKPNPVAGTISGDSMLCQSSSVLFSDTVPGGVWSSGDVRIATVSGSGLVTSLNPGHVTIYYAYTNSCGTATASKAITINPLPAAGMISGPAALCNGATAIFSETDSTGSWMSTNASLATIDSFGYVTTLAPGVDTIEYVVTDTLGCSGIAWQMLYIDSFMVPAAVTGAMVVCAGSSISLSDADNREMPEWSLTNGNAAISSAGVLTGLSAGIDTVLYWDSNACNSVTAPPFFVTIQTAVFAGAISGPSQVCAGSIISLSDTVTGGIWLSGTSAVAWVDGSGDVTGRTAGTTIISYVLSNSCGASAATDTITVVAPAAPISGSDSVGVGRSITLYDSIPGGTWMISPADTIISLNSATGVVEGLDTGTIMVTYEVNNACGTSWATEIIFVGYPPTVPTIKTTTNLDTVCRGYSLGVRDALAGGRWTIKNGNASLTVTGDSTAEVFGLTALDFDTVNYTVTNAFGSTTTSIYLFVNEPPVDSISMDTIVSLGTTYNLSETKIGGGASHGGYWVSIGDTVGALIYFAGAANEIIILQTGKFELEYIDSNSCGMDTARQWFTTPGYNGVTNVNASDNAMNLFPNPNTGSFYLILGSANESTAIVTITNMLGVKVKSLSVRTNAKNEIFLDDQPAGIYFIEAITPDGEKCSSAVTIRK